MTLDDRPVVLDTNILVHLIRRNELGQQLLDEFDLLTRREPPLISYVTIGELHALAQHFGWGERKRKFIDTVRMNMVVQPIESDLILRKYAEIDACATENGRTLGKNDLWIGATASATDSALLTTDKDFNFEALTNSLLEHLVLVDSDTGKIIEQGD